MWHKAVHPRVGGERDSCTVEIISVDGSSPRGRGTLVDDGSPVPAQRFIPAWAGNAGPSLILWSRRAVHPRVGGERAFKGALKLKAEGSSPRGRGTPGPVRP